MINSKVIGNYISLRCVKKYYIEIYDKEKSYKLTLANESPIKQNE
jgi:hypothetical protein